MAVYKPTYCYPYLEAVDLTIPDGEKYFTCQIDTSNIKITGYRVELYNENNERVFSPYKGKISPLSELNDTGNTLGLNGSELRFPFVQHWDSKIYPSYNAIYFKATNYVDYYQAQLSDSIVANGRTIYKNKGVLVEVDRDSSVTNEEIQRQYIGKYVLLNGNMLLVTSENCVNVPITTLGSGERSGPEAYSPIFVLNGQLFEDEGTQFNIDDSFVFVGDTLLIGEALYTADYDGLYLKHNLSEGAIVYIKGGAINAGKILQYQNGELVDSAESAWCDVNGNSLAISNKGKTYKWQITLYSGERGAIRTTGAKGAVEISYDSMADNEFNTVLTSGTILGSTADRIQGPISDKIYAKQWLQLGYLYLDDKGNSKFKQVGIRTYIESYSQSLGCIYPISGDSRGFSNDNLYPTDGSQAATHFAVYKYSNDPNSITSQNSVDQSVNFALTGQGMTYQTGSYSYEIVGRDKIDAFNIYCKTSSPEKAATTPLCDYNYNEDNDTYEAVHAGESVLIWNKENSKSNPLTGYFTINFSTSDGADGKKIPKFVFDMAYAYRKVSSYIGKVFFVKGGSFANENIVSKAEATGVNDVVSLGDPITFTEEEPLEIYPDAPDATGKLYGEIYKNSAGKVYVSPFVGLQAGARLYVSDGTVIKAQTVDTMTWAVTYAATAPASTSAYSSTNPLKYEIRTNFKSSDETPFYAYDTPRLVPWSEHALSVIGTNGYEFLLEFMGQILTVPIIFSSEIHARYVHVTGQYLQAQNVSWTSYRWLLVDEYGQVIQDTGKQYDGLIETTFYGLDGPTVDAVETGKAMPTAYYPVLIVEDELGNSLIMGMKIEVSLDPRNLPMEFSGSFDCKTQSVIMKITDYGYPKFSKDLDNKATVLSTSEGMSYQITEEGGGTQAPVNPLNNGDTITALYVNKNIQPDVNAFDWNNPDESGTSDGISYKYIYLFKAVDVGSTTAPTPFMIIENTLDNGEGLITKLYSIEFKGGSGNVYMYCATATPQDFGFDKHMGITEWGWLKDSVALGAGVVVSDVKYQDIWGAYISKDGQWKSGGGSKVVSGEVKILGLDQQGQLSSLAADQVKIPFKGAQLKHFFAKDTTEIPDLSKAPKKLATNNRGNIEFHTKVKLDANFCGEILKYSVDIFDTFGNTDKLNILLELPNNFDPQKSHDNDGLNEERNKVKCTVSTKGSSKSASGVELFTLPSQEAYYLQPFDWIDRNGDITNSNKQGLEYLDFIHPFDVSGAEQKDYTNINEPINTKAKRNNIGECCLQVDGGNYFNKWTDFKRIQIETPAGYRVVQTAEPAMWQDSVSGAPMIWTEGWSETADTKMVQVKRHAEVDDYSWFIDCYMKDIDELYNIAENMSVSYANNQWIVSVTNNNQSKDYIFLMMNK